MHYGTLSNSELVRCASADPRFEVDPLFTELVARVDPEARRGPLFQPSLGWADSASNKPLKVDAHVR